MKIIGPGNIHHHATGGMLAVGTFDGLHLGHRHLVSFLQQSTCRGGICSSTVITFSNHPRSVLHPGAQPDLLSTLDEKIELFEKAGVNFVYLIEFTVEFAQLSPREFVEQHIVPFKPHGVVIGREHFFGKNKEGNVDFLQQMGKEFGFCVQEAPLFELLGENVSSSQIRTYLQHGNIQAANTLLGYSYFFSGKVIEGNKIGTVLGYPTANLKLHDRKLVPASGIYAAKAQIEGKEYLGMLYIGTRPTFESNQLSIEMNLFGFSGNLYNQIMKIEPVEFIRGDKKFDTKEQLIQEIKSDEYKTKQIFGI
jgi:riboflavin kinase / FMN adenylyltransferase